MGAPNRLRDALAEWLQEGGNRIGEVAIRRSILVGRYTALAGRYKLSHWEEVDRAETLERFSRPEDARSLAQFDDAGRYRPLKTAPNLRHGWLLELESLDDLCLALDFFYPAALGVGLAFADRHLAVVPLRETLSRQSGMYAVTRKISNADADKVARSCCNSHSGCLKTILWELEPGRPLTELPPEKFDPAHDQLAGSAGRAGQKGFPLLCNEACNLLVAAIRKAVKTPPP